MHGVPTYVEQLTEMFHGVIVDGSSSCIPGSSHQQEEVLADEEGEDQEGEGFVHSPLSSNSRKRTTSTADTDASPAKKSKSPMMKMFQGIISELQVSRNKDEQALAEMARQREEELLKKQRMREEEFEKRQKMREMESQKKKEEAQEDINRCLFFVKDAGAGPNTQEFYVATRLFHSEYNRMVFNMMDTKEDRLTWLKKAVQDYNNY